MRLRTARQVDALYALLLGRRPEGAAVYDDHFGRPVTEAAEAIIGSEEFAAVLDNLRRHGTLPHQQLDRETYRHAMQFAVKAGFAAAAAAGARRGAPQPGAEPEEPDWVGGVAAVVTSDLVRDTIIAMHRDAGLEAVARAQLLTGPRSAEAN